MEYVTLGRTGLRVSVAGLGCGGVSRLGLGTGRSEAEAVCPRPQAPDGVWDVVMIAFHMMHHNARTRVFPRTIANRVGTLLMFAVRNIFSRPERLAAALRELTANGQLPRWLADAPNPLGFLIHAAGASTITEAAYRFVRHEPGVDVVLFGTGDPDHLRANIASLLAPPLPLADRQTLTKLFGRLVGVGLDPPYSMPGLSSAQPDVSSC